MFHHTLGQMTPWLDSLTTFELLNLSYRFLAYLSYWQCGLRDKNADSDDHSRTWTFDIISYLIYILAFDAIFSYVVRVSEDIVKTYSTPTIGVMVLTLPWLQSLLSMSGPTDYSEIPWRLHAMESPSPDQLSKARKMAIMISLVCTQLIQVGAPCQIYLFYVKRTYRWYH